MSKLSPMIDGDKQETPMKFRCIWCRQLKPRADFNTEHVMPQSFGTFESNLTLVNTVCEACNSFFSKALEPSLARDMPEGFDRYQYGMKETSDFKSLGKRSTTRVQVMEGVYAGAWAYASPRDDAIVAGCSALYG